MFRSHYLPLNYKKSGAYNSGKKGKEQWEIARTAGTKVTGDLKVGSKVTIEYTMTATDVTVKADKPATPKAK